MKNFYKTVFVTTTVLTFIWGLVDQTWIPSGANASIILLVLIFSL